MKLKYYMRGIGIGIFVTAVILSISIKQNAPLSDQEIMDRAKQLGMYYEDEVIFQKDKSGADVLDDEEKTSVKKDSEGETSDNKISDNEVLENENREAENTEAENKETENEQSVSGNLTQSGINAKKDVVFVVDQGSGAKTICEKLKEEGLITDVEAMEAYLKEKKYANKLHAGKHTIPSDATVEEISEILISPPEK